MRGRRREIPHDVRISIQAENNVSINRHERYSCIGKSHNVRGRMLSKDRAVPHSVLQALVSFKSSLLPFPATGDRLGTQHTQ